MRIWLPTRRASWAPWRRRSAPSQGNVVGLEVLEREAGVAIDELVVELPDEPGAVDAVCRGVRNVPGAGVEEVTELTAEAKDREDTVLAAAAGILQAATPTAAMNALTGHLIALFDLTWLALADDELAGFAEVHGDVPSGAVGRRVRRGLAQRRRPGQRHDRLGRLHRARSGDRASPSAAGAPPPSGGGSATRSRCSSWWRRASWTRWPDAVAAEPVTG